MDSEPWHLTPAEAEALSSQGEHYAAGYLRARRASPALRQAAGLAMHLSRCPLPPYLGELIYPCERSPWWPTAAPEGTSAPTVVNLSASYVALDLCLDTEAAERAERESDDPVLRSAYGKLAQFCRDYPRGGGYTHGIINYGRLLDEGFESYGCRLDDRITARGGLHSELDLALSITINTITRFCRRIADYLASLSFADPGKERNRKLLAQVYNAGVPLRRVHGFYEAMVATTFFYALDGCDDLGRFDQYLRPYYEWSLAAGEVTREEARRWVRALWQYVDDCSGWNVALAGSTQEGGDASSDFTCLCLEAAQYMRRPNLALRVREDMPDAVWDAAIDTLATGTGLPALYCEENYLAALDRSGLDLPADQARNFAFGGCTETMLQGCSCVGSLDADFGVLATLERSLHDRLRVCRSFEKFMAGFEEDLRSGIRDVVRLVNRNQAIRAQQEPLLIRTLLVDDCLNRGRSFYNRGARFNWSVVNIIGLSNAIDSLAAVRKAVFEDQALTAAELLAALRDNFEGHDEAAAILARCPRFGNDVTEVDELAARVSSVVYREFEKRQPWRGGRFLCGTLMFVTYGWFGRPIGATPDGRRAGAPVCDSAGPVQGRDTSGPTAMLRSVAALDQVHAPGTLVVNIRLHRELFESPEGRAKLRSLVRGYFAMGGLQLQVNVVDQEALRDAIAHPELHGDLIVRVGGYSEYFNRLEEDLKWSILERTEHR